MNILDYSIITKINYFAQHSWIIDNIIRFISDNHLLKGGILTTIIWWLWFNNNTTNNRKHIIVTLFSSVIAMILVRFMVFTFPFRYKPMHTDGLNFVLPYGMIPIWQKLNIWSSFPSDHAVLFFCLSSGLFFISKKACKYALLYTLLFIVLPRVYLGLHYPTDIIFGATIGISIAWLGNIYFVKYKIISSIVNWSISTPKFFYPLFFLFTFQIAEMFESIRSIIRGLEKLLVVL